MPIQIELPVADESQLQPKELTLAEKLQQQAEASFKKRESLSTDRRKYLAKSFSREMSRSRAWIIARDHGLGKISDMEKDVPTLTQAWLVLGGTRFYIVGLVCKAFEDALEVGRIIVSKVVDSVQAVLKSAKIQDIREEIESVSQQLEFSGLKVIA